MTSTLKLCVACAEEIQAKALLCKHCGTVQADFKNRKKVSAVKKAQAKPTKSSIFTCPMCKKSDAVLRVSSVVDSGQSASVGVSLHSQVAHPTNMFSGFNVGTSSSTISRRLTLGIPSVSFRWPWLLAGTFLATIILRRTVFAFWAGDNIQETLAYFFSFGFGLIPGFLVGGLVGQIAKKIETSNFEPTREKYIQAAIEIRNAYYCSRDDVAFNSVASGTPEEFMEEILAKHLSS